MFFYFFDINQWKVIRNLHVVLVTFLRWGLKHCTSKSMFERISYRKQWRPCIILLVGHIKVKHIMRLSVPWSISSIHIQILWAVVNTFTDTIPKFTACQFWKLTYILNQANMKSICNWIIVHFLCANVHKPGSQSVIGHTRCCSIYMPNISAKSMAGSGLSLKIW